MPREQRAHRTVSGYLKYAQVTFQREKRDRAEKQLRKQWQVLPETDELAQGSQEASELRKLTKTKKEHLSTLQSR